MSKQTECGMDYGYQLLRHVVAQVFGNLGHAARITLLVLAVPFAILLFTNPEIFTTPPATFDPGAAAQPIVPVQMNFPGLIIGFILVLVAWLWAAVAWHRFVLLEEYPSGVLPTFHGSNIGNYFGNAILIGLIIMGAAFVMGLAIGLVLAITQSIALGFLLGVGLVFGISWIATRIGLILPASAIGERLRISDSWAATRPVSGQIMLPIIVIALVSGVLTQGIPLILGYNIASAIVGLIVGWLQLLVNLALMTTLYGNLIQGRQLN